MKLDVCRCLVFSNPVTIIKLINIHHMHDFACTQTHVHTMHIMCHSLCVHVICIEDDMINVNKYVKAKSHNLWFEAKLVTGEQENTKIMYCYISPKVSM